MPIAPNPALDGSVDPVALLLLAVILVYSGNEPAAENIGEIIAANTNPAINAHIAPIAESMSAYATTGIFATSVPSKPNFTPPNLGTNALYSIIEKKLLAIVMKNAPIGSSIIKGSPIPVITLNDPKFGIAPVACTIVSTIKSTTAAINPKIPAIKADILVKGVSLTDLISFTSTIFFNPIFFIFNHKGMRSN